MVNIRGSLAQQSHLFEPLSLPRVEIFLSNRSKDLESVFAQIFTSLC